jgi:hypothetical protein
MQLTSQYQYSNVTMTVCKQGDSVNELALLKSTQSFHERDNYVEFVDHEKLESGIYWILVNIDWDPESFNRYRDDLVLNINSYGVKEVSLYCDTYQDQTKMIESMMTRRAQLINMNEFKQPSQQINVFTYSTPKPVDGFFFTYVINND